VTWAGWRLRAWRFYVRVLYWAERETQSGAAADLLPEKDSNMPISTSSFGDERDSRYGEYTQEDLYEEERMDFPNLTPDSAEQLLKRLGGGVSEKHSVVEGIGWKATIEPVDPGVSLVFKAHDELLDDLIRRFEELAARYSS
jgi:hypothetical protein